MGLYKTSELSRGCHTVTIINGIWAQSNNSTTFLATHRQVVSKTNFKSNLYDNNIQLLVCNISKGCCNVHLCEH